MKISVVIPTYNRAEFLTKTLESIFNQTVMPDEIIVIDDGSSDNTKEILQNQNIIYCTQENKGVSSARNKGIELCSNEWICFLDSDDIWHPQKLEKQIQFHKDNPDILFSYTDEEWIFNNKPIKQKTHQKKENKSNFYDHISNTFIGTSTVMIHKDIFHSIGVFDTNLTVCEDYDLWLRILSKYQIGFIDEELIKKIAGHKGQLSFETPLMDTYRIQALLKHMNSTYKDEVLQEVLKKCHILIKGAKKYNNEKILQYYKDLLKKLKNE